MSRPMDSSPDFVRARRRHRALMREKNHLEATGSFDKLVNSELAKIESEFPQLKISGTSTAPPSIAVASKDVGHSTAAPAPDGDVAAHSGEPAPPAKSKDAATCQAMTAAEERGRPEAIIPSPLARLPQAAPLGTSTTAKVPKDGMQQRRSDRFAMAMFAMQVYNETHQRSVFGPVNFMKTVVLGVVNALFHYFVADPCSLFGAHIVPSAFCAILHLYHLYSLFLKRPGRISAPMLIVYTAFDYIPSLVSIFVIYIFTLSVLNLVGPGRVSFQC